MKNFEIAKVLKPQGIKGEIKVELFLSDLDFLHSLKSFEIDGKEYNVESIRFKDEKSFLNGRNLLKHYAFVKTKEINDRNNAEYLRGKILCIEKPKNNSQNEFFIEDLVDCCVIDEKDKILGYVESVEKYSSVPIINVLLGGARKSFPFIEKVLKEINIKEKKIVVFKNIFEEILV